MTRNKEQSIENAELRRQAEERVEANIGTAHSTKTEEDSLRLHHELQVHRVELEMQNTELRHTRDELETALEQYTDLYDFAPVSYFTLDRKGTISRVNLTGAVLVGVERSHLVGRAFGVFVTDDTRPAFTAFLEKVFTGPGKVTCEVALLKEKNTPLFAQVEGVAAASGEKCRIALIDISERKLAEEVLRESEERLRLLVDGAKDYAIIMLDIHGHVTSWNEGAKRLKGWDAQEIMGRHFSLFYTEEARAAGHPEDELAIAETEGKYTEEGWRVRKDGSKFMADVLITAIHDESGKLRGFSKITRDISERKQAEVELREAKELAEAANQAKSQFLVNMSHELRTPMTGILGMLQLTLQDDLTPMLRNYLETTHNSAHALLRILNDILDMAKFEAGKLTIEDKPFSLKWCISEAVDIVTPEVRRKGLDFDITKAEGVPDMVDGDQLRLRQVLINLIGNAVKFTEGGKVKLHVSTGGTTPDGKLEFEFAVTDTGIGIPDDKKELLFRSFSQVDASLTRSYGGTGLGLAISLNIVELMGGTISFVSEEGVGSTFSIIIPLREDNLEHEVIKSAEAIVPEPITSVLVGEKRPCILLVEDDAVIRQMLGRILNLANYETDSAEDGQIAVEKWEKAEYDLVLMDIMMPRLDGLEATRVIRKKEQERGGHTPIVAMTAHARKEDEQNCIDTGMDAYISKPIDFAKTLRVIEDTIRKRSSSVS